MVVWTIQSYPAWERLQSDGTLYGPNIEDTFVADHPLGRIAYTWMAEQMEQRMGPGPKPGIYPLWAWYQWRDAAHPRPDLRASAHLPYGMQGARIEFESTSAPSYSPISNSGIFRSTMIICRSTKLRTAPSTLI